MIKFIHKGGPYGDATSNYDIGTNAKTVGEFIDALLEGQSNQRYITIGLGSKAHKILHDATVAYIVNGKIIRVAKEYDSYCKFNITSVESNGGWGSMTFTIITDDEFATQDREEHMWVQFGR